MKYMALVALLFVAGCKSPVPANTIRIKSPRGDWSIATPKNVSIEGFRASVDTNGSCVIDFAKWTSTNDPEVIGKSYAGRVAEVNAWSTLVSGLVEAGAKGAVKGVKGTP